MTAKKLITSPEPIGHLNSVKSKRFLRPLDHQEPSIAVQLNALIES
jgi:hypothetical protein